jgi:peptide/nickel transport system ATP-binding protein
MTAPPRPAHPPRSRVATSLLDVRDLSIAFEQYRSGLHRVRLEVVAGLDLTADAGQVTAVVGASGSGKSLLAHAVLGVLPHNAHVSGEIRYDGARLDAARQATLRGRDIALIPQSVAHLDPVARVGAQSRRAAALAGHDDPAGAARAAYERLGLPAGTERRYPHELSGGMARRVLTATATIGSPRLVIADEPTPGLHADVVTETLRGLRALADTGAAVVLITHDIERGLEIADRVAVFYAGTTVEVTPASSFTGDGHRLAHPYTRALWQALPANGFTVLPGAQPPPTDLPPGCLFADRCPIVIEACHDDRPSPRPVRDATVRCIRADGT